MRCSFFGIDLRFPVMIAPSAMHGQAHEDGEKATARAAVRAGLYVFKRRDITEAIVKKAEALGYRALCLTVDAPITGRRERDLRSGFTVSDAMGQLPNIQMLGNVVNQQLVEFEAQKDLTLDWSIITWLKSICNLPVIAKGILHPADARCAIKAGAAAIVISNHGGRQLDSTPATIDVLPAIAAEVRGEIPIFLDGGIRRGTDVFKALGPGGPAETAQTEATEATFGSCGGF
ncbi:Peroxisomal (S)-2-hydroxy-acid oxidase GLO5 (Glycolate oxidase 3) (AtGLO5) (GOX 3) (Short chain alpha-hydroxy acid oxidase GLO5) [Durusdinium trenchii]|uniref:Peroxisomal (S)-2-hydroxy-acid oxidase GLO5 (Glycolate oxidase 3) (AtGLO5) (GOX 3) (Short chain alpha-hydroxy acid oxidase GLO5) n=1 Tax=Durusdinium trenchii TaxID=1381693 RepID=A0ABP0M4V9_9DINO